MLNLRWLCALTLLFPPLLGAYSVLTHEAIIDSAWDQSIKPLLVQRFPQTSEADLKKAHAFAYGGSMIQDMGYYPFGNRLFSDITHYVRTGDFVLALLEDARDVDEYAFALGSLAHYAADNDGHPMAVNPSVADLYPKLRARYGDRVTYEDNPVAHMKTEFGFDVEQVALGHYAPQAYHDFIGFEVSKPVLERAFQRTYGLRLNALFRDLDLALGTYRRGVSKLLPEATKIAWSLKKDQLQKDTPGLTRKRFLYNLSRASYEHEWGSEYERPGWFARVLAFLAHIIPKVGPLRGVDFKPPTPETGRLFMASFNTTLAHYREFLRQAGAHQLVLANRDFDTGRETRPGEYRLADKTYSMLLRKLEDRGFECVTPGIRDNILAFYRGDDPPAKILSALDRLKSAQPSSCGQVAAAVR